MTLFQRANRRHLLRQPLQTALSVLGISLGVAVVLAVDLANDSALRAFQLSEQALSGNATHTIVPASPGIDEDFYVTLRIQHGFQRSAPRITGEVETRDGRTLRLLGIDPLAAPALALAGGGNGAMLDAARLIGTPKAAILNRATAEDLGLSASDRLMVQAGGRRHELKIIDTPTGGGAALEGLRQTLIVDLSTAQVILNMSGRLSRIDLALAGDEASRLQTLLPASLSLRPADSRSYAMARMTQAFRINLTALSLLALLIGGFLIYNTQTLFVLTRRETFAVWRTLGVTRGQVVAQVLSETAWMALAGCVLGCLAGLGLSRLLLALVTRTINDLYFSTTVQTLALEPWLVAKACLLGVVVALLAAVLPALEASRARPRLALSRSHAERSAARLRHWGLAGALLLGLLAATILLASRYSIGAGFVALFCVVAGFTLLVPTALRGLLNAATPALGRCCGWMGLWSARNTLAAMSRTQIAVAALTVALAATIGVSVMIQSFRLTVAHWLDNYLRADIYISQAADDAGGIDPALIERLARHPDVESLSTGRWRRLPTRGEPTRLFVLDVDAAGFDNFQLVNRTSGAVWPVFADHGGVLISESYAYHQRLAPGDALALPTSRGEQTFDIVAVYYDYGSDRGTVVMHRKTYGRHWNDPVIDSMAAYLAPGVDSGAFLDALVSGPLRGSGLVARSNERIKTISLEVFDRTFTVTEVLRLLTLVIAAVGILGALVAIQMERVREIAVLRACGMTRGELSRVMMLEGGLMGVVSALLAMPLGILMAAVLVHVINQRSFGWSMQFTVPGEPLVAALVLGLGAGVAAALYPAWRMNRRALAAALRYE